MIDVTTLNAGQKRFLHEYTRNLLIAWGKHQFLNGEIPQCDGTPRSKAARVFVDYAITKGWVKKDGKELTSGGFISAAGRLKN